MSNDLNKCLFIGRLGKEVDMRYLPNGDAVANFSIAVGESWKDRSTGDKVEKTTWVRIVAFRKLAEICGEYLKKGSQVYVAGKFTERKWQDNNGQDRYTTEVVISEMQMLDVRGGAVESGGGKAGYQVAHGGAPSPQDTPDFDADIPFS